MLRRRLPILISTVLGGGSHVIPDTILFREEFTNAAADASGTRDATPGPGNHTIANNATITNSQSAGKLVMPRPSGSQAWTNNGLETNTSFTRTPGLLLSALVNSTTIDQFNLGFHTVSSLVQTPNQGSFYFIAASQIRLNGGAGGDFIATGAITAGADYNAACMLRSVGMHFLIKGGTQFASWTRLYVSAIQSGATLYAVHSNYNAALTTATIDVRQKNQGHWLTDFGGCTYFDATPTANDTAVGVANALQYITWTPASNETLSMYFRYSTDDETYRLDCSQAGSTIKLYSRTGGVDTEKDAGKTQTWTAGSQYRVGIMYDGDGNIRTFVETTAGVTLKHSLTGESFNLAVTGAKVAGFATGANWEIWPRTLTGTDETDVL